MNFFRFSGMDLAPFAKFFRSSFSIESSLPSPCIFSNNHSASFLSTTTRENFHLGASEQIASTKRVAQEE